MIEFLQWAYLQFVQAMLDEQVRAVIAGLAVGMAGTEATAHMLPPHMDAWRAGRIVRLLVFGGACICSFALNQTLHGFVWAVFAGLAAPTLYTLGTRCLYARWPALEPRAIKP